MKAGTFWALMAVIAILVLVGWTYLPTWPNWLSLLWTLAVIGLSAFGFWAKVKQFVGPQKGT